MADVPSLPAALDVPTAARLLGIGKTNAYQLAARDELPVPVVRVGRTYRVPTAPLLTLLGIAPDPQASRGLGPHDAATPVRNVPAHAPTSLPYPL